MPDAYRDRRVKLWIFRKIKKNDNQAVSFLCGDALALHGSRIGKMSAKTGCFTENDHARLVKIAAKGSRLLKAALENVMNGTMME